MQTNMTASNTATVNENQRAQPRSSAAHPIVRGRIASSALLTVAAVAIGIGFGVAFGAVAVALYALTLPVALLILWRSADVMRSDEEPREHE